MAEKTMGQLILEVLERVDKQQQKVIDILERIAKALPTDVDLNEPADEKGKGEKKGE